LRKGGKKAEKHKHKMCPKEPSSPSPNSKGKKRGNGKSSQEVPNGPNRQ
jgi:hypothetical protein